MIEYILCAPNGAEIIGTVERIPGVARIVPVVTIGDKGKVSWTYDYEGETVVDWDGQETMTACGETMFQDDDGGMWLERELVLRPRVGGATP